MGSCVLKECGFHLNTEQQRKERVFKDRIRSEFFMKLADDFDSARERITPVKSRSGLTSQGEANPKQTNGTLESHHTNKEKSPQISDFRSPEFRLPSENTPKKPEITITSPFLEKDVKRERPTPTHRRSEQLQPTQREIEPTGQKSLLEKGSTLRSKAGLKSHDLGRSGTSSDYHTGFHNKLFSQDISSGEENTGNAEDFEQIFKEDESDDESYLEKLFPGSVRQKE